jgi:CheY-like chemotaxis protein
LRNPLAPISNVLQAWPLIEHDRAQTEQMRGLIDRQVRQMIRLIDDLLDVSRVSRGKLELRKQRLDLAGVVEAALEGVRPFVESRHHQLSVQLPDKPVALEGDPGRLMQVIGNLVHNAAKYTGGNGHIWITAGREDAEAVVSVRDDGPGIPREMLSDIFEMFAQVDQTLDRAHGGLGIGLTLVKTLIELHGGTVEARSEGPGRGSEFIVRLPVAVVPDVPVDVRPTFMFHRSAPPLARRVLVVDDVRPSANTLALMLSGLGQEAKTAYDGMSALELADQFRPEVMFLDIAMPGMDGYEVARRIRSMNGFRPVLVALTGYGQEEDRRRAFEAGFDHHLVKPTSVDALHELLTGFARIDKAGAH